MNEREICEKTGKICYSRKSAGEIVNSLKSHPMGRRQKSPVRKKIPIRYYFCRFCKSYHTTHFRTHGKRLKEDHDSL